MNKQGKNIVLENQYCRLVIDEQGNVCSLIGNGTERLKKPQSFCVIKKGEESILPSSAAFQNKVLNILFEDGNRIDIELNF